MKIYDIENIFRIKYDISIDAYNIRYIDGNGEVKNECRYIKQLIEANIHTIVKRGSVFTITYLSDPNRFFKFNVPDGYFNLYETVDCVVRRVKDKTMLQLEYDRLKSLLDNFKSTPTNFYRLLKDLGLNELLFIYTNKFHKDLGHRIDDKMDGKITHLFLNANAVVYDSEKSPNLFGNTHVGSKKTKRHQIFKKG